MTQDARGNPFPVFDGDSHVLEPADIWERYLEPEYRVPARSVFWHKEGDVSPVTILNGQVATELYAPVEPAMPMAGRPGHAVVHVNIRRHGVWRPGMSPDEIGQLDPGAPNPTNPGASDPQARLADMDRMGVDQALLFPTYFAEYFPLAQDPDVAHALARAYNNWILDFCSAAPDRLFPVAVLPMQEINAAVSELRRVSEAGFKAAFIRPVFIKGRFPHHPYYYPLWEEMERLGVVFCSHPSWGYNGSEMDSSAPYLERITAHARLGHPVAEIMAGNMDNGIFLAGMMTEGLLERFPGIKLYLVHSKASWVHLYLEKVEGYMWLSVQKEPVSLEPEEIFFRGSTLINYDTSESAIWELPDLFEDCAAWGSFYPMHDTYTPAESIDNLTKHNVSGGVIRKLLGGNVGKLLGVEPRVSVKETA